MTYCGVCVDNGLWFMQPRLARIRLWGLGEDAHPSTWTVASGYGKDTQCNCIVSHCMASNQFLFSVCVLISIRAGLSIS